MKYNNEEARLEIKKLVGHAKSNLNYARQLADSHPNLNRAEEESLIAAIEELRYLNGLLDKPVIMAEA